ncbi:MAG: aquaporin [Ilumatobacter sp.]|uniref:aquaporin n=1 Tax=Ilumatobacter sp. TaxID=1967498 RepID=UPI00262599FF|nr:aquaporin [Ilumatobacter sp.]MDJ0770467.1 aquaporin [Ilumatobacter sp.]
MASAPAHPSSSDLIRRLTGEFIGTFFLLAAVVGSGIMAADLTRDEGLRLLQNAIATGAVLVALILAFAAVSGAHFNPAVTLTDLALGGIDRTTAGLYVAVQTAGGIVGVIAANLMFDLAAVDWSSKDRSAGHLVFADGVATLGLLLMIFLTVRRGNPQAVAFAVGGYIAGAYYFTSSTSFANPAVTVARMFSDTFAGIEPASVPMFVVAQLIAVGVAVPLIRTMTPDEQQLPASAPVHADATLEPE